MGGTPSTSAASATSVPSTTTSDTTTTVTAPVTTVTTPSASPTPIVSASPLPAQDTTVTAISSRDTSKLSFCSVATSLTVDADKPKPAVTAAAKRWYNWNKPEHRQREQSKVLWYMNPPVTSTDGPIELTTTTPAPAVETTMNGRKEISDVVAIPQVMKSNDKQSSDDVNISVTPSFQLRSTAVYSPPHGDRVLPGRREPVNTDVSNFKYYHPGERSKQPAGIHTKATMYRMNTLLKQTSLPTHSTSVPTTATADDASAVRTYVSRGLQTDLEVQPTSTSSSQMHYYEKQQTQVVPLATLSDYSSSTHGFYHLASPPATHGSSLPPIGPPSAQIADQSQPFSPSNPSAPPPTTSVLKKSSTVLSQERPNPLAEQTQEQVLEELRKRNKNLADGTYRVKKVHLLEKSEPRRRVTFDLPPTKASQSIMRSQKLFFS